MVTWTKAAQGAIIVVLLLYCFLEAQRALQPSPPAADPTPPAASSSPTGKFRPASDFPAEPGSDWTPTRCLLPRAPLPRRACRPRCASAKSVPGVANGNWHYQCFLHWKNIPDHQMPTPATYQGVGEIYSLEDGTCTDDMNRGVLKVILHEVCAAKE